MKLQSAISATGYYYYYRLGIYITKDTIQYFGEFINLLNSTRFTSSSYIEKAVEGLIPTTTKSITPSKILEDHLLYIWQIVR